MGRHKKSEFMCGTCGAVYASRQSLHRHGKDQVCGEKFNKQKRPPLLSRRNEKPKIPCKYCDQKFQRVSGLNQHIKRVHSGKHYQQFLCGLCTEYFSTVPALKLHRMMNHSMLGLNRGGRDGDFMRAASAHRKACEFYKLTLPPPGTRQPAEAVRYATPRILGLLRRILVEKRNARIGLTMNVRFRKVTNEAEDDENGIVDGVEGVDVLTIPMNSSFEMMRHMSGEEEIQIAVMFGQIDRTLDSFVHNGSGWVINNILGFDVQVNECHPLAGECCSHGVTYVRNSEIPKIEHNDENVRMDGDRCFYRAVAASMLYTLHKDDREYKEPTELQLEEFIHANLCEAVYTPVNVADIDTFEEANEDLNIAVNVMYQDDVNSKAIYPARASRNLTPRFQVNLLLFHMKNPNEEKKMIVDDEIEEEDSCKPIMHYACIKNLESMMGVTKKTKKGKPFRHTKHLCFNCFLQFHSHDVLVNHVGWCHLESGQKKELPYPGEVYSYNDAKHEIKYPWFFVFDFECLQLSPKSSCKCTPELLHKCTHKTSVVTEQAPFAYGLVMVDRYGAVCEQIRYMGEDAAEDFVDTVLKLEVKYRNKLKDEYVRLKVTPEVQRKFNQASACYLCHKTFRISYATELDRKNGNKPIKVDCVMDHDHLTGEYLGAAHNRCNVQRAEMAGRMVGYAHNFSNYDSHCVMKAIAKKKKKEGGLMHDNKNIKLDAIPLNTQKFKILKINRVMLLDSMSFLNDSLDRLMDNLRLSNCKFDLMKQWLPEDHKRELMLRKGIYPYEAITSMEVLKEEQLPTPEGFASKLTGSSGASPANYQHAQNVWKTFNCKNMGDYSLLYVMSDCFQLLEIIWELRNTLFDEFHLDMCHYFSLPMMSKEILFKSTEAKVELLSDPEMIHMIRSNIRGGLSFSNLRYCDVQQEFEKRHERVSIAYLDCVNLYGYAMSQKLPVGGYRWLSIEQMRDFDPFKDVDPKSDTGYIVECTLKYPDNEHISHNSLPLAPHQQRITGDMLSAYARTALEAQKRKVKNYKADKLTSSFLKRDRYVCHAENLKLYLELGMELVEVHRIIAFDQEDFIRPYIEFCSKMRAESKTKTRSALFKLLANAVYGKMIENSSKRMDLKFVHDRKTALRRNTDPRLRGHMILDEDFSIAFMAKKVVKLNQMWAVGFTILELSKAHMMSLYYKTIKPTFNGKVSIIMSDTDSYLMMLSSPSVDEAISMLMPVMDTSNYPDGHPLQDLSRKNQPGLLKNESPANDIVEAVSVRSKVYAYRTEKDEVDSRCKGVKKSVGRAIAFDEFKNTVLNNTPQVVTVTQHLIQSKDHVNRLMKSTKTAMTSFDDKRSLNKCGIHSYPYGSALINERKTEECKFCEYPFLFP